MYDRKNLRALFVWGLMVGASVTSAFASARDDENADMGHPQALASADAPKKDGDELPAAAADGAYAHLAPFEAKLQKNKITLEEAERAIQNAARVREEYAHEIELLKHRGFLDEASKPSPLKAGLLTQEDYSILMILSRSGHPRAREVDREISHDR